LCIKLTIGLLSPIGGGLSDKSCLWILSRRKIIDGDLLQSILTWLLENDYDIDNLVETPHDE